MRYGPFIAVAAALVAGLAYLRWAMSGAIEMNAGFWVLTVLALGICGGIAAAGLVAIRADVKGRLRIVAGRVHTLGDRVDGHVDVAIRSGLDPEGFEVALVLTRRVPERDGHRTVEIWRHTEALPVPERLSPGAWGHVPFSLPTPPAERVEQRFRRQARAVTEDLGPLAAMAGDALVNAVSGRDTWKIETRLALPGIDLTDSLSLTVNEV